MTSIRSNLNVKTAVIVPVSATMALLMILALVASVVSAKDTTNLPPVFTSTNLFGVASRGSWLSARQPVPGLYVTHPSVCLVKVPRPTGDNCILGAVATEKMPLKNPRLTLIPVSRAKK